MYTYNNGKIFKLDKEIGHLNKHHGYIQVNFFGKRVYAHRLAWFLVKGYWPNLLDHVNGIKSDNRIENLREVSVSENAQNRIRHRKGSLLGVRITPSGKWRSDIRLNGKIVYLGTYETQQEAHEAYVNKLKEK